MSSASGAMSLRDPSARKIPARFAESDLSDGKTSSGGRPTPARSSATASAGDKANSGAKLASARSGSPVTPGPPPGYCPPSSGASSAAAPAARSAPATAAAPPTTSTTVTSAVKPSSNSAAVSEAPSDDDPTEDHSGKTPPSAQRPRARKLVPARPNPDPVALGALQVEPAGSSSRRIQPDCDDDFFVRRRVVRDIHSNPPASERVELDDSDQDHGKDEELHPVGKKAPRTVQQKDSAQEKEQNGAKAQERVDGRAIVPVQPARATSSAAFVSTPAQKDKSAQGEKSAWNSNQRDSEEEAIYVDLTNSSPSPAAVVRSVRSSTRISASPAKASASSPSKTSPLRSASSSKAAKGKGKAADKARSSGGTLTPEEALERAKAAWRRAHDEANARMTAESGGLHYNPPTNPASKYYLYFQEPYLKQHTDPGRDEVGIGWSCRCCLNTPYVAWRARSLASADRLRTYLEKFVQLLYIFTNCFANLIEMRELRLLRGTGSRDWRHLHSCRG